MINHLQRIKIRPVINHQKPKSLGPPVAPHPSYGLNLLIQISLTVLIQLFHRNKVHNSIPSILLI